MLTEEQKEELDKAINHINAALNLFDDDFPKYDCHQRLFDFMYKFDPSRENACGKLTVLMGVAVSLMCDYEPDNA